MLQRWYRHEGKEAKNSFKKSFVYHRREFGNRGPPGAMRFPAVSYAMTPEKSGSWHLSPISMFFCQRHASPTIPGWTGCMLKTGSECRRLTEMRRRQRPACEAHAIAMKAHSNIKAAAAAAAPPKLDVVVVPLVMFWISSSWRGILFEGGEELTSYYPLLFFFELFLLTLYAYIQVGKM